MSKTRVTVFVVMALMSVSLAACAGLDLGDLVRVEAPNAIQQQTGLPSSTTLNEAEVEYQAWFAEVKRSGASGKPTLSAATKSAVCSTRSRSPHSTKWVRRSGVCPSSARRCRP